MGAWQAAMDALARYGGCNLNGGGTYKQIITSGTPTSSQVLDKRGFIAIVAVTDTTVTALSYDTTLWSGETITSITIPAGQVRWLKFSKITISAGECICVAAGQGSFTNGS